MRTSCFGHHMDTLTDADRALVLEAYATALKDPLREVEARGLVLSTS